MRTSVDDQLTIREVATRTGLSEHNLRYYERIGLIRPVERDRSSRHRRYGAEAVVWVYFLRCMRATNMPLALMHRYVALVQAGAHTAAERRSILEEHKKSIEAEIRELQGVAAIIDKKIEYYYVLEEDGGESERTRQLHADLAVAYREQRKGQDE